MAATRWEFWIDVGGTFTDCLAKSPDGGLLRHKLLSSGVTKGRVGSGSSPRFILDAARGGDPVDFWTGWRLTIVGDDGKEVDAAHVTGFEPQRGLLKLSGLATQPSPNASYELRCELEAPVIAVRYLLGLPLEQPAPPLHLRLGTTRGTNALITLSGARTALATTRGFGDVLEIGYQARPRLFDLTIRKPPPIAESVVEVDERVTHDGAILAAPRESAVREQLSALLDVGVESLAICLLHADRHRAHEQLVTRIAHEVGFREISVSHIVAPLPKFVARADTTVVDAYLNPVLREYVLRLRKELPGSTLRILTSAGGLVAGEQFCGKDSILSGPAGGVVGFSRVAQAAGFECAIGFDMGGTSTDVSRFDGRYDLEYETQKAGVRLVAPTLAIETVAAGGGSLCRFDGVKLVVGPESAGADPGPACYGRGGPLTVTDVNLYLKRIVPERFPIPLDRAATERRLRELAGEMEGSLAAEAASPSSEAYSLEALAAGLLRIANANMASAIRSVTVAKGADPAEYVLVAFGGAAAQHACAVARELGIRQVLIHPEAGVLSALGIGLADVTRHRSCGIEQPLDESSLATAREQLEELESKAIEEVHREVVEQVFSTRSLDLSYEGVNSVLTIDWPEHGDFSAAFADAHRRRYGYIHAGKSLTIVAARVAVVGHVANALTPSRRVNSQHPIARRAATAYFDGAWCEARVYERTELAPGDRIFGPAIVTEDISTTVIDPDWQAEVLSAGELLLTDEAKREVEQPKSNFAASALPDPVLLEIFNNHLTSIAEQMGVTLRNTASSVNVKERLDYQLRDIYGRRSAGGERGARAGASGGDGRDGSSDNCRQFGFAAG